MKHFSLSLGLFLILSLFLLAACQAKPVALLIPSVIATYPHDSDAFTQGLLLHNGLFYESTGLTQRSTLREVEVETGKVKRIVALADKYFAEGLARVDNKLYQLTWQSGEAFVYDLESFERLNTFNYTGEGWGLCYDGRYLYMSDGSSNISQRNVDDFSLVKSIKVILQGETLKNLNELECVGNYIYANIWQTKRIIKINKTTGVVEADIDASAIVALSGAATDPNAVLNGIAYNPDNDSFYITGKLWPKLFEVRFVEP